MKIREINVHIIPKWETIPVYLNGNIIHLAIYPLRRKGDRPQEEAQYALWGDPDNADKLQFVVAVGFNREVFAYVPYSIIDPSLPSGQARCEAIRKKEQRSEIYPQLTKAEEEIRALQRCIEKQRKQRFARGL